MNASFTPRIAGRPAPAAGTTAVARPILLSALGLMGLGLARPAHAQTPAPASVQVTQPDGESLRVRISNPTQKAFTLRVVHLSNGRWVLNETHQEPAYGTRLRFNDLPTGRYAVVLRLGEEHYRYTVDVDGKTPGAATIAVRELTSRRMENVLASAAQ